MTEKETELQAVESDKVNEQRRALLKKAASLAGSVGLAGLTEFAATNAAAASSCGCHTWRAIRKPMASKPKPKRPKY